MAGAPEHWPLVGRDEELAMLDEQVGEQRGSMVIAGSLGVGKSRLLTEWVTAVGGTGRPTVVIRATRSTGSIPFGAFASWVPEHLADTRDRLGVLRATAARLAELGPGLVVAVDDAQLLDDGSAALVLHLAQHGPGGLLVVVRSGEPCPDGIVALWKECLATRLDVQPLSEPETVELVGRVLGGSLADAARRRLWHLSDGNPLYLREVVDAALARGVLTASPTGWRWTGRLTGHDRLTELVRDRVGPGDPAERRALEIVALGEPVPSDVLSRLVPRDVLGRLEGRGVIVGESEPWSEAAGAVRLVHPLYGEVVRSELAPFTAQSHHRALAEAAVAVGAHEHDPLRVATWMLDSGDAPSSPDVLLRGAAVAMLVADHPLGARLAEAAERAGAGWRATLQRAEALGMLNHWDEANALLAGISASASAGDAEAHAAVACLQADLSYWYRGENITVAQETLDDAIARVPPTARASLLNQRAAAALVALDLDEAIRLATAASADAATVTDRLNGLGYAALAAVLLGRTTDALASVELAAPYALGPAEIDPGASSSMASAYVHALVLAGRIDDAAIVFELLLQQDLVRIGGAARALADLWLARSVLAQGRVATAVRLCHDALDLLGDVNLYEAGTMAATTLASAAAQAGDGKSATEALAWIDTHRRARPEPDTMFVDLARAWTRAGNGEHSLARHIVLDVAAAARAAGAWTVELLALLEAARLGAASRAAARLDELTRHVEGPYAVTAAQFADGLAAGDGGRLDAVAGRFAAMGARLVAAEAAATAAGIHARNGRRRAHAASLAQARQLAAACEGAATPLLAGIDDHPLAARLTDREREVTELAARGHTSREIADALTISARTVDSHLNHAYTKLGITNRRELVHALGHHTASDTNRIVVGQGPRSWAAEAR